jgi:hypothetical protein
MLTPATWSGFSALRTSAAAFFRDRAAAAAAGSGAAGGGASLFVHQPLPRAGAASGTCPWTGLPRGEDTVEAEVVALARVRLCAERWATDPTYREARAIRKTLLQFKVR